MYWTGLIIGAGAFLCIGVFHPIVIKSEYYFGVGCWWVFALVGILSCAGSILASSYILSTLLAVFGFSCFWSIFELFEQRERVRKGWFPSNPNRKGQA